MKNEIILITTIYEDSVTEEFRFEEFKACFDVNISHPKIKRLVYFFEPSDRNKQKLPKEFSFLDHPRVEIVFCTEPPTFKTFFEHANLFYPNNYIVVHNGDIYFLKNSNIERVKEIPNHKTFWVLTRYYPNQELGLLLLVGHLKYEGRWGGYGPHSIAERLKITESYPKNMTMKRFESKFLKPGQLSFHNIKTMGSADSYCFYSPIKITSFNIRIGTSYCDGAFMIQAKLKGFKVLNPSLSIVSCHVHKGGKNSKIKGKAKLLPPNKLPLGALTPVIENAKPLGYLARIRRSPFYVVIKNYFIVIKNYFYS